MSARRTMRFVALSAGSVSPRFELCQSVDAIARLGVNEAARLFGRHKVRSIVSDRLRTMPDSPVAVACLDALAADLERVQRVSRQLPVAIEMLVQAAANLSIPVGIFKGSAVRRWYSNPGWRDIGDLDVFMRSWADAQRLREYLHDHGYTLHQRELPWLKRDATDKELYGQILLAGSDGQVNVDIHFGRYSVRHCAHLPIQVPGDAGVHMVGHADNVSAVVNNAAGDLFASMKDVNDLLMAADQWPQAFSDGIDRVNSVKLDGFLVSLLRLATETSALNRQQQMLFGSPGRRLRFEPAAPSNTDSWSRRWIATTMHAYRVGRTTSVLCGARLAVSAQRYYRRRLSQVVVDAAAPRVRPSTDLNEHTCVRLVPVALVAGRDRPVRIREAEVEGRVALGERLSAISTTHGELVAIGDELFIPTVFYRVPADLVRTAERLSV